MNNPTENPTNDTQNPTSDSAAAEPAHRNGARDRESIRRAMTAYFVLGPQDV